VEQQLSRTRRGTHRPLLDNPDPRGTLAHLFAERSPLYEGCAHVAVDTDGRKVSTVVDQICSRLADEASST
jgi:shikimate kinase